MMSLRLIHYGVVHWVGRLTAWWAIAIGLPASAFGAQPSLVESAAYDQTALLDLASRLELGLGMPADPQRSMALFCQAARQGSRVATLHVAAWLLTERDHDDYPGLAAAWLRRLQFLERGVVPPRTFAVPVCPTDSPTGLPTEQVALAGIIDDMAASRHVPPVLVKAIIAVESNWGSTAVSPKGAMGLMQVMPSNFQRMALDDPFDPAQNIRAGIGEIARLLGVYKGDVALALAAYNAGEIAVNRCSCVPDNGETLQYVNHVRALMENAPAAPSPRAHPKEIGSTTTTASR